MTEIIAVFTYKREELLALCLEAIRADRAHVPIVIFSDRGYISEELCATSGKYDAELVIRQKTIGYGNSFNVIEGMRYCVGSGYDVVHCIEDDTIIHPGYLKWAAAQLLVSDPMRRRFSVALGRIPGDIASTWYESPCASWNAKALAQCLEKVPLGYFAETREEMQKIVDAAFPNSRFRYGSAEQDGFFLRCLEFFGWKTVYPDHSFASHIGAWGYNNGWDRRPTGTFEERIEFCRKLLHDRKRRTEWFGQAITEREMGGMNA